MTTKGAKIILSTSIVFVALAIVWFLELSTVISVPPGKSPWYSYAENIVALIFFPIVPWVAARYWHWPPLLFGFGVFSMYPVIFDIFGPEVFRGHLVHDSPYPQLTLGLLCSGAGVTAALIGLRSHRASLRQRKIFLPAILSGAVMLALHQTALSEGDAPVTELQSSDSYAKVVRQLEAGETNIDYRAFRESFLESEHFKTAAAKKPELDSLRKTMHELMKDSKRPEIIEVAKKMLSIDYTDMETHKILQQTYKLQGDAVNQMKYHDIEFGLLNSIVRNGDGKTCQTAWPVIQVTEEYFILEMLGAKVLKQSLDPSGPCDRMEVRTEEGQKVYYFGISKVFKGYKQHGIQ